MFSPSLFFFPGPYTICTIILEAVVEGKKVAPYSPENTVCPYHP